ncbi:hypothetical protein [Parafrankia sp. EUN1f]|uniref:hypothetical protein n=1 Tax=Parafrankia sp. EUN1f TaxID=102897 RepID=UPI0001C459AF|nr:hypothetical protein [Parafrankia sp. EUN1f]EFC86502.1 hypothetical protein FrEUN1fDRAFT_0397 [Parafrankia sp. EUN1f]
MSDRGPMLTIRADTPEELRALSEAVTSAEVATALAGANEMYKATLLLGPLINPQAPVGAPQAQPQAQTYPAQQQAPQAPSGRQIFRPDNPAYAEHAARFPAGALHCNMHGPRSIATGVSSKNGQAYVQGICPQGSGCSPVYPPRR